MSPIVRPLRSSLRSIAAFALAMPLLLTGASFAVVPVPPAAPTDLQVKMTVIVVPPATVTTPPTAPTYVHEYTAAWTDNSTSDLATQEDGFTMDAKVVPPGTSANSVAWSAVFTTTSGLTSDLNPFAFQYGTENKPAGTAVYFRIRAFKGFNVPVYSAYSTVTAPAVIPSTADLALNAPTALSMTATGESVKLSWVDNSNNEAVCQIEYRDPTAAANLVSNSWRGFRMWYHDLTSIDFGPLSDFTNSYANYVYGQGSFGLSSTNALNRFYAYRDVRLVPGHTYEFRVRARRGVNSVSDPYVYADSQPLTYTMPDMLQPDNLTGTATDEKIIVLNWADHSNTEMGYSIEYQLQGETAWNTFDFVNPNVTTANLNLGPSTDLSWRVRGVFQEVLTTTATTPVNTSNNTYSLPSSTTRLATVFKAPTNLAFTNITSSSVTLHWTDNSAVETGYELLGKLSGDAQYSILKTTAANANSVTYTDLIENVGVEFALRAVKFTPAIPASGSNPAVAASSVYSDIVGPLTREGFIGTITPVQFINTGSAYSSTLTTSNSANRSTFTATPLPPGLSFNASTGVISGTPTLAASGKFDTVITATWSNGQSATANISFRVSAPSGTSPIVLAPLPNRNIAFSTTTVDITGKFKDPDVEQAVRMSTTLGDVDIALYAKQTPLTVANFLAYANAGNYNGIAFHRAISGFILQAGSFKPNSNSLADYDVITKRPSPLNEPGISNLAGTLALAKISGQPNSGTSDFFINLGNNNATSSFNNLDTDNGGFTVFGRVLGNGLATTVASIVAKPQLASSGTYHINAGAYTGDYANWPLDFADVSSLPLTMDNTKNLVINSFTNIPVLSYSASSSAPSIASVSIVGGVPQIQGLADGTATITITATDLEGHTVSQDFFVTVNAAYVAPQITTQPTNVSVAYPAPATFSVQASGIGLAYQWRKEGVNIPGATLASYTISNPVPADAGSYSVVVSDSLDSVASNAVTLSVSYVAVSITTPPATQSVLAYAPVDFSVVAAGDGPLTYQWKKGGVNIPNANSATYHIDHAAVSDVGSYTVAVSNITSSLTSSAATLAVANSAAIATQPVGALRGVGSSVTFTVVATGDPTITYQWKKGGAAIPSTTQKPTNTASYTIPSVALADAGDYTVTVTNTAGSSTSDVATLTVLPLATPSLAPPEMKRIPGGTYKPSLALTNVTLPAFWLGTKELTNSQFAAVLQYAYSTMGVITITPATGPGLNERRKVIYSGHPVCYLASYAVAEVGSLPVDEIEFDSVAGKFYVQSSVAEYPARNISWYGAYLASLVYNTVSGFNTKNVPASFTFAAPALGSPPVKGYSIPTEDQWEWAARGGSAKLVYPTGPALLGTQANFGGSFVGKTQPVGSYPASKLGLFDLAGNVAEWVVTSSDLPNSSRYTRGGGWFDAASLLRNDTQTEVTNADQLASRAGVRLALDDDNKPLIATVAPGADNPNQPHPQLVRVGDTITFTVIASGAQPLTYQWLKAGKAISGKTSATLSISNAQLTDGGDYSVVVSNALGKLTSATTSATVIDSAAKTVFAGKAFTKSKIGVTTGGPTKDLHYLWHAGSGTPLSFSPLANTVAAFGATSPTFELYDVTTILDFGNEFVRIQYNTSGSASYSQDFLCAVTKTGVANPVNSGITHFQVLIDVIIPSFSFPTTGKIGVPFGNFDIPKHSLPERRPLSYTITGLPAGMTYDKTTGRISGTPTVSGSFAVTVVGNGLYGTKKSDPVTVVLNISGPPVGKYTAPIARSTALNLNFGGLLTLDTTALNTYSGKVILGAKTYSFKGILVTTDSGVTYTGRSVIDLTKPSALQLDISISGNTPTNNRLTGTLGTVTLPSTTPSNSITLNGWRNRYSAIQPVITQLGLHNMSLSLDSADVNVTSIPQGVSVAAITVASNGSTTVAGTLSDGTPILSSGIVGPSGEVPIWEMLYTGAGSIAGGVTIAADVSHTVGLLATSPVTWQVKPQASSVKLYQLGFGPLTLTPAGGHYIVPSATPSPSHLLVMGLEDPAQPNNAKISLTQADVTSSPTWSATPGVAQTIFSVTDTNLATFSPSSNPGNFSLTFTPATGDFKGSFIILNPAPSTLTRTVPFTGKIIPGSNHGLGTFILPALPGASAILGGKVELSATTP